MAVKGFFDKNKEIFTHDSFIRPEFPYFLLTVRGDFVVKATYVWSAKTLWFFSLIIR